MKTIKFKNEFKQKEDLIFQWDEQKYVAKQNWINNFSTINLRLKTRGRKITPKEWLPTEDNLIRFYKNDIIASVNFDNSGSEKNNLIIIFKKDELLNINSSELLKIIKEENKKLNK